LLSPPGLARSFAACAEETLATGTTVERVLRVDGKQVPIPGGSWVVAADTASDWNDQSIGAFGYLRTLVLLHVVGSRIDTMLEVNTNVLPTTDGWVWQPTAPEPTWYGRWSAIAQAGTDLATLSRTR
jgi:hypothetical protein